MSASSSKKPHKSENPNWFNSFYLNGETTGTWWKPNQRSPRWVNGYETLYSVWKDKGRPEFFRYGNPGAENEYQTSFPCGTWR